MSITISKFSDVLSFVIESTSFNDSFAEHLTDSRLKIMNVNIFIMAYLECGWHGNNYSMQIL